MRKFQLLGLLFSWTASAGFLEDTIPNQRSNRIFGFQIVNVTQNGSRLYEAGVKKNDVVLAVNDKPIESRAAAEEAYSSPQTRDVTVLRANKILFFRGKR